MSTKTFAPAVKREVAAVVLRARKPWPEPKLMEHRLGAGVHRGFTIDFQGDQMQKLLSAAWLANFEGIRIIGEGPELTHLVDSPGYQDSTVFVGPHLGIVQFESLTLHGSERKALHVGLAHKGILCVRLRNVHLVSDKPGADGIRDVWGGFSYCTDWDVEDTVVNWEQGTEHGLPYGHNLAKRGGRFKRVRWEGSGAEGSKWTQRPHEGPAALDTILYFSECSWRNWKQPHSWRGGAGLCVQGAGAHVVVERSVFWGGLDSQVCRCLMVDDGGADHYGLDGVPGGYPPNGWIIVLDSAFSGRGTVGSSSPFLRVGPLGATQKPVALGFWMKGCSAYGKDLQLPPPQVPTGRCLIEGNNTPALKEFAHAFGIDVSHEAGIPLSSRVAPVSEGFFR